MTLVKTRYGFNILTDPNDALRLKGRYYYEKEVTDIMLAEIRPGEITGDIGAMIGYHTVTMAQLAGPEGAVYAFEPSPANYRVLGANIDGNRCRNAMPILGAAGAANGEAWLYLNPDNAGDNSIYAVKDRAKIPVRIYALDDFYGPKQKAVSFLKIDTQGFEIEVLKGAREILKNPGLRMVVEYYPRGLKASGATGQDLLDLIQKAGFFVFLIDRQGRGLIPIEKINLEKLITPENGKHVNLFCGFPTK